MISDRRTDTESIPHKLYWLMDLLLQKGLRRSMGGILYFCFTKIVLKGLKTVEKQEVTGEH
jgi:hypothetical protein